jgi:pimeloyl-ACP methyl ester carboxylesterase/predicted lipid carrier protein YhbT
MTSTDEDRRELVPRPREIGRVELERALREQMRMLAHGSGSVLADRSGTIVLNAGAIGAWTVVLGGGRLQLKAGAVRRPTTTITADARVLADIALGRRCGAEAFLAGELTVRGDLALSLHLDAADGRPERPARWPRAHRVTAMGFRTNYLEAGPPDGAPVLLLHGLGATNASMLTTLWELGDRYRVLAPDLPGHGATAARRGRYDAKMFAEWVGSFLDETGIARAVVLGNSLGGRIALEVGFELPQRVDALVLLAPAAAFRRMRQFAPLVRAARHELAVVPLPITHRMAVRILQTLFAEPSRLPDTWYDAASDEFQRVFADRSHRIAFFAALRQIYLDDAFGDHGFWTRLAQLHTPALFVWGERDRLVPAAFARHVVTAAPNARSVVIPDCGHVPQFEFPDQTHALVRTFLEGLRQPGARAKPLRRATARRSSERRAGKTR